MFKRSIVLAASLCMLSFATPVSAQSLDCQRLDLTSMTPDQLSMAQTFCASASKVQATQITPDKVREWASIGKDFSTAIVETAKGLGQTANQFLFTPVGIMIAFYFMWGKIGGIIIGIPLLIASWFLYRFICSRYGKSVIEYENVPIFWGMLSARKIKRISYDQDSSAITQLWGWMAFVTLILNAMILSFLIF